MNPRFFTLVLLGSLVATGCGKKGDPADHDHAGSAHDQGAPVAEPSTVPAVTFKPGTGLTIPPDIRTVIALTTAPAEERVVPRTLRVSAQIFKAGPPALATLALSPAEAASLTAQPLASARLVSRSPHGTAPDSPVDLVLSLVDRPDAKPGDFLSLTLALADSPSGVAIPRSALLRSVGGTFVYVVNGGAYLRTAVVPGAESATHLAIADGLYAGDEVVTHPVEQLWLMELHLTQGRGGHSH